MDKLAAQRAGWQYNSNSFLAALSVRLLLEFEPRRTQAMEVEKLMIAGHLRVANIIPQHREYVFSSTPSEPIVAEAACQVLRRKDMVHLLSQNVNEGLIEKGQRGELVARLLLTLAHDQALETMQVRPRAYQGQLDKLYTSPIPVENFFRALFTKEHADTLLTRHPDNDPDGPIFQEAFSDAFVMFTHFGKAADDRCMSHTFMFMALCRNMAISCWEGMHSADICIPIHFGRNEPLSRNTTSAILVSVKNRTNVLAPSATSVDVTKMAFTDGTERPFIILILQLGVQGKARYVPTEVRENDDPELLEPYYLPTHGCSSVLDATVGLSLPGESARIGSRRVMKRSSCYTIDARGCRSSVFRVVKADDEPLFSIILSSDSLLSEHGRKNIENLKAVLAQKPFWTLGSDCGWAKLTTPDQHPHDAKVVPGDVVYGNGDIADDDVVMSDIRDTGE
jgi:hypothetical protein